MVDMARRSDEERMELFRNTASRKGLNEAIVEKDFWVCYMLDYLFHRSVWKNRFVFKGGTSLSKAFHLINRFSEDIDLVIDWRVLGYGTNEPWKDRSKTKQDAFNLHLQKSPSSKRSERWGGMEEETSGMIRLQHEEISE